MAGVTYNQQTFPHRRKKLDLRNAQSLQIFDTSLTSEKFFNIVDFPEKFTSGKNLFKIKAAAGTLVDRAPIYVEILDFNGDPIYHEVVNYAEHDGTRVVSVWIYPDTAPGPAVVYVASRAAYDEETQLQYPYSTDPDDRINGVRSPNLIWSRTVTVAPELRNDTEIIFLQQPTVIIEEVTQPYLQITNLRGINLAQSGSGTVTIRPYGSAVSYTGGGPAIPYQGGGTAGSPPSNYGSQFLQQPLVTAENFNGPTAAQTNPIFTVNSFSLLESNGFALLPEMVGGTITISDPAINITTNAAGSSFEIQDSELLPSDNPQSFPALTITAPTIASGSFEFLITEVLNSTQAKVAQISGFRDPALNTNGSFEFPYVQRNSSGQRTVHTLNRIESSDNFTASYFRPPTTAVTEQSQSFAEIRIENLSPATGDVYKIKTLFKAGGLFGDFEDLGDTVLEEFELLEDPDNLEISNVNGVIKNRIGFFTSLQDFETYWTGSGANTLPEQGVSTVFNPSNIVSGVQIRAENTFNATNRRFAYIHISSSQYHADLKADTIYKLQFKAHATDNPASSDPNVVFPRVDVYVSGSTRNAISVPDDATRNSAYVVRSSQTQLTDSLQDIFEDNNTFGKRLGSVEFNVSQSINDVAFNFLSNDDDTADIFFVIRRGQWTLADISLVAVKETGFTPNVARINKRIPRTYFDTPLTFRFQYLDYRNNIADMESYIYPVTFKGENTVITGVNNIVSGSLFLSSTPGSGIEMHGGSAFIRSVGYKGFASASAGTASPGFMFYSGSALPDSGDEYNGVGFEFFANTSSFISLRSDQNKLDIRPTNFQIGGITFTTSSTSVFSGAGDLGSVTASVVTAVGSAVGTLTLESGDGPSIEISDFIDVHTVSPSLPMRATHLEASYALSGSTSKTSFTYSSSFDTTLDFRANRIMSVTTGSALTMSIDADLAVLGNVIMTDVSSSVGLYLTGSEFKILNGTFDTTKRNYVYYHYIGNNTALVTINQEQ